MRKYILMLMLVSVLVFMVGCGENKEPEIEYTLNSRAMVANFILDINALLDLDFEDKETSSRFEEKYNGAVFTEVQKQAYDRVLVVIVEYNKLIDIMDTFLQEGMDEQADELIYQLEQLNGDIRLIEEETELLFKKEE